MESINIVWFKKDLRLMDHAPLRAAIENGLPTLLLFLYEPSLMRQLSSDDRHWRFIYESIADMNNCLREYGHSISSVKEETLVFFEELISKYNIQSIFSYQETGDNLTFERDKKVAKLFKKNNIEWKEFPSNGIIRGAKSRAGWDENWHQQMTAPQDIVDVALLKTIDVEIEEPQLSETITRANSNFQPGGFNAAAKYLGSFLAERHVTYCKHISQPLASRRSCSRISPYLTYGNMSMRQVYQATLAAIPNSTNKRALHFFIARLHWHCHFIQKFEQAVYMEFRNLNAGFDDIRTEQNKELIEAWENAATGFPLVDACLVCLKETGYINFRMRAMLVSFFTHHLWQPWQATAHFLARLFLDYEAGIHYPQIQMQAGTMGVNTIRIYNPVKQALEQDPEGLFIKKWLPQLANLPLSFVHEPWLMTEMEQKLHAFTLGVHYPKPIINVTDTAKYARELLWKTKGSELVRKQNVSVIAQHVRALTKRKP